MSTAHYNPIKVVVVGDGAVGKTSLLIRFAKNTYVDDYIPTVFDNYTAPHTVDGQRVSLNLWDTAGQHEYSRLRPLSYPETDVFLVCFSLVSPTSYDNVMGQWLPELAHHAPHVPIVLVGLKMDLRDDPAVLKKLGERNARPISYSEGLRLSKSIGAAQYHEASALSGKKVVDVFETAARLVLTPPKRKTRRREQCTLL